MSEYQQRLLVENGALVFLLGLAAGFPFAIEILGRFELWPIPGSITIDMPGDLRGWRMAHLEGILNGLLLLAGAAVGPILPLTAGRARWVTGGLLICAWGNILASWLGPLSESRGLVFSGATWNSVVYLLFIAAIVGVVGAMIALYLCARTARRQSSS